MMLVMLLQVNGETTERSQSPQTDDPVTDIKPDVLDSAHVNK
jgi:hypothetical protein